MEHFAGIFARAEPDQGVFAAVKHPLLKHAAQFSDGACGAIGQLLDMQSSQNYAKRLGKAAYEPK